MIRKIDSNIFSLTILKVTTFSRIRHTRPSQNQGKVTLMAKIFGEEKRFPPKITTFAINKQQNKS